LGKDKRKQKEETMVGGVPCGVGAHI